MNNTITTFHRRFVVESADCDTPDFVFGAWVTVVSEDETAVNPAYSDYSYEPDIGTVIPRWVSLRDMDNAVAKEMEK